jgi:UDP-N-acetylmuramoylalanine--D-glutamate ligase
MNALQGQTIMVLGLGASGLAMARWCHAAGATVMVWDNRDSTANDEVLRSEMSDVLRQRGPFEPEALTHQTVHRLVVSPGLSPADIAPLCDTARQRGIAVEGELSLFQQALQDLARDRNYHPQVLAITGTNGKTTVTSLTGLLVERAGKTVAVAGNIGPSLLDTLAGALKSESLPQVWVLELSSFQLHHADGFNPHCATVLNLSQDHLDWHGSMAAYLQDKLQIFGPDTIRLVNRDQTDLAQAAAPVPAPTGKGHNKAPLNPNVATVSFGSHLPQQAGDYGLETVNGMTWLVKAQMLEPTRKTRRGNTDETVELVMQRLMPAEALRIRGRHNALNALAALALAESTGAGLAPMLFGLREYRGEPHRVEPVGIVNEVEYFDDSKGTNVGATVAAIAGLGPERRLVLILGGDGKGQDFSPLRAPLVQYARAAILIGRDASLLANSLEGVSFPVLQAHSLPEAVLLAAKQAQSGDAVLMSPACASLDMFRHYGHRAEVFVEAVQALAREQGQEVHHG